jgi:hypothetical protein
LGRGCDECGRLLGGLHDALSAADATGGRRHRRSPCSFAPPLLPLPSRVSEVVDRVCVFVITPLFNHTHIHTGIIHFTTLSHIHHIPHAHLVNTATCGRCRAQLRRFLFPPPSDACPAVSKRVPIAVPALRQGKYQSQLLQQHHGAAMGATAAAAVEWGGEAAAPPRPPRHPPSPLPDHEWP